MQPAEQERVADDVDPIVEVELVHRIGLVGLDGFDADLKPIGDFSVQQPPRDHPENFFFAFAQQSEDSALRCPHSCDRPDKLCGHSRIDVGLIARRGPDRSHHFFGFALLENVAMRSGAKELLLVATVLVTG